MNHWEASSITFLGATHLTFWPKHFPQTVQAVCFIRERINFCKLKSLLWILSLPLCTGGVVFTILDTNKKVELARLCGVNASDSSKKVNLVHLFAWRLSFLWLDFLGSPSVFHYNLVACWWWGIEFYIQIVSQLMTRSFVSLQSAIKAAKSTEEEGKKPAARYVL